MSEKVLVIGAAKSGVAVAKLLHRHGYDVTITDMSKIEAKEELEALAKESSRVQEFTEGKQIVKVIYVPGKLVNIVVK